MILLAALLVFQCCVSGSAAGGGSAARLKRIEDCSTSCSQVKPPPDLDALTLASSPQACRRALSISRCEWQGSCKHELRLWQAVTRWLASWVTTTTTGEMNGKTCRHMWSIRGAVPIATPAESSDVRLSGVWRLRFHLCPSEGVDRLYTFKLFAVAILQFWLETRYSNITTFTQVLPCVPWLCRETLCVFSSTLLLLIETWTHSWDAILAF